MPTPPVSQASAAARPSPVDTGGARPAFLFHGIPENRRARAHYLSWDKRPQLVVPGTASFLLQLKDLPWRFQALHFGTAAGLPAGMKFPSIPCINFMADADLYATALGQAVQLVTLTGAPCFNPPAAVLATSRDAVARRLADIPGLQMPTTVRINVRLLRELRAAMDAAGITYPVIVRMAGDQGGVSTVRVDSDAGWELLNSLPWGGNDIYLTQYVDFSDDDGCFRKVRLAVVGEQVLIKHHYTASEWMIHFKARGPKSDVEEPPFLDGFEAVTLPKIRVAVLEMARRLGLDYFGIDASVRPDGRLLVFEANATMNMLDNHSQKGTLWLKPTAKISDALRAHLSEPAGWRCATGATA